MAVWGAPKEVENGEWHAIQAALEMQNALFDFNRAQLAADRETIEMGVGINYGSFVAGNMGANRQRNYTIIGDDVNIAARIEAKAGPSQVFVSETAYDRIKDQVCAVQMPPIEVKGIPEPITIYSIRGSVPIEDPESHRLLLSLPVNYKMGDLEDLSGYVIGAHKDGDDFILEFMTADPIDEGSEITCAPQMTEYIGLGEFSGKISGLARGDLAGEDSVTQVGGLVLSEVPDELMEFFRPGNPTECDVTWDDVKRGS
jgi:hypothetical protein